MPRSQPPQTRVPLHLVYFLLLGMGILSGLWLHGHPILTLVVLMAVLPLSLVTYVPRRFLNDEVRQILHYLLASAAIAWGIYRFREHPPLDILLIEVFTILGLSFAFTSHQRGHSLMLLISVILVFYGSVAPPRSLYIWVVPISLVLALVLLYQSRVASLSGQAETDTRGTVGWRNSPWILAHAGIVLALWGALVMVFPTPDWRSAGIAPVSFQTRNRSLLPPRFQTWFRSPNREAGREGKLLMDGTDPTVITEQARVKVENAGGQGTFSPESGGSGFPGDDLVMRVRSPLKLYWLGQLYDEYDGLTWKQSLAMTQQHLRWNSLKRNKARVVKQTYVIEKWASPSLFAAYLRASRLSAESSLGFAPAMRDDFGGVVLAYPDKPQPVPFAYEVQSYVDFHLTRHKQKQLLEGWYESVNPAHYQELPMDKISARVQDLARKLGAGKRTELERAYAIRDYLRESYKYEVSTKKMPEGREPVDYFLFDLHEGHCEYFAAAMTVLARLNGLPARVGTGYSPGNYNVLTEVFEVYEYHAHAWSQVFIPGKGWLTMDATPAGSLPTQTQTTPPMIGNLRDPFSDEWRIQTPELSSDVKAYIREQTARSHQGENGENAGQVASNPGESSGLESLLKKVLGGEGKKSVKADGNVSSTDTPLEAFTTNVKALISRVKQGLQSLLLWLRVVIFSWGTLLIVLGIIGLRFLYPRLRRQLRRRRKLQRSHRLFSEAGRLRAENPELSILSAYKASRGLLDLAGLPKLEAHKDLFEYLQEDITADLREPVQDLFQLYIMMQYQPDHPGLRDAERAYSRAKELRFMLLPRIEHPHGTAN